MKRIRETIGSGGLLIILAGSLWGTTGIFSHLFGLYQLSTLMMSVLRVSSATLILTVIVAVRKGKAGFRMTRRGYVIAAIQGILTQTIFSVAYFTAIKHLGMSSAVVLLYTSPIYVTIISRVLFGEKVTGKKILTIILTIIGCALTATGGVFDLGQLSVFGIFMGLTAGFCYGTLAITGRYLGETDDPLTVTYYTFLFGLLGLVVTARPWTYTGLHADGRLVLIMLASGLVSAVVPYLSFSVGITKLKEVSMAPILSAVENIVATAAGYLLFGERVGPYRVIGILLVMFAIYLGQGKEM